MMGQVFYHSPSMDKDFTAQEWSDYCKTHSPNESVRMLDTFAYNINGVCLNPDITNQFKVGKCEFIVKVSQVFGGWVYGYEVTHGTGGASSPCSFTRQTYATRTEAARACLMAMQEYIKGQIDWYQAAKAAIEQSRIRADEDAHRVRSYQRQIDELRTALLTCKAEINDTYQLTLF